jgi:hypothetical protein
MFSFRFSAVQTVSRKKYLDVLYAAKYRFKRMKAIKNTRFEVPRSSSVSDNMWARAHKPLTKAGEGGLFSEDEALFLGNLLVRNILEIPGLPAFSVRYVQRYKPMPASITKENLVAFTLGLVRVLPTEEGDIPFQHAVGFFKKNGKWHLIDNEIGFLHEFQDQEWFETIFLKRLFYTNQYPDKKSGGEPSEKVFIQFNDDLLPNNLIMQFVTLGARSYPNVEFNSGELPFEDSELNFKINGVMAITSEGDRSMAGTTGGGSAVAESVGGARRHPRRKTRRLRRKN